MRSFDRPRSGAAERKPAAQQRRPVAGPRPAQAPRQLAGGAGARHEAPAQAPRPTGGLPEGLQVAIEAMSSFSLADVVVHRNSAEPARLGAAAFTQGNRIHLAPGQERHLPHEAWHVVQQKQGRVRPTIQLMDGLGVNHDAKLEREADRMGAMAVQPGPAGLSSSSGPGSTDPAPVLREEGLARRPSALSGSDPVQRVELWELRDLKASATTLKGLSKLSGFSDKVDRMLENGSAAKISYGELFRLVSGLTGWSASQYVEGAVSRLAAATGDKFIQDYAEIYNAIQRGPRAGFVDQDTLRPGRVFINAVKGKDYELTPGTKYRIDPVDEADAFFHGYDGKVHLEEVKATPQAFFDKLVTKEAQFENMLKWRDMEPNRVVSVRIHLNKDFEILDRIERYSEVRDKISSLIFRGMEITVNEQPIQKFLKPEINPYAMDMPE